VFSCSIASILFLWFVRVPYMRVGFGRGRRATLKRHRLTINLLRRTKISFRTLSVYACMHVGMRVCMWMKKIRTFIFTLLMEGECERNSYRHLK
jgi:hypothetical protein